MHSLFLGIVVLISLVVVPLIVHALRRNAGNEQQHGKRLKLHEEQVAATVVHVQTKQGWKDEERWYRDPWDGGLKQQRAWKTYYEITAQWVHPQTKQIYTFREKRWADSAAKIPTYGEILSVRVDPHLIQACGEPS